MSEINEKKFNEVKQKAIDFFKKNRIVKCPAFGEVSITPEGFGHIEWKSKNHKRPMKESYIRYLCFLSTAYVLNNSKLYQEFREEMHDFILKRKKKNIREKKEVSLYGFVAITNHDKNRIKIIIRKVAGWNKYEFVSVIPVWKNNGYGNQLFFDNKEEFLKVLENETKKPSN